MMNENTNETPQEFEDNLNLNTSDENTNSDSKADTRFEEIIDSIKDEEQFQTNIEDALDEKTEELVEENQTHQLELENEKLKEEIARNRADYYNLQQEYSNYVRRSKADIPSYKNAGIEAVVESMLSVFDDIDAARKHGDLEEGPFVAIANKLETTLKTGFDVERFGAIGDEFDPNMHEALLVTPNPTVTKEEIGDIIQSGWKIGDRIIRAAKVVVFSPAE